MDRHVIEAMGRTRVVIEDGRVTEVGSPVIEYCPLFKKYRKVDRLTPEAVRQNVEFRLKDFGMCTRRRELRMRDFLTFGVSEIVAMAVSKGMLDCAVTVCDGAGTVVVTDPELIQGIGGRLSGMVETSPFPEVIDRIGRERVLGPRSGRIDQVRGAALAFDLGFRKPGVTVVSVADTAELRRRYGSSVGLFAVHTTGVSREQAEGLFDRCDIVTACASKWIREVAARRAVMQVGSKIPVYAATPFGMALLQERMRQVGKGGTEDPEDLPSPLV